MTDLRTPTSRPQAPETTVSFATLGCKTNQFESAAMQERLSAAGYRVVSFEEGAALVIVNTCTVTSATDAQSRNLVRRARRFNPECRVVVTGCYAQVDPQALRELPGVSMVLGNEEKQRLLEYLDSHGPQQRVEVSDVRLAEAVCLPPLTSFAGRSRAFVQIQNGCDAFCSYCIIPYARGASRSASPDEVITQIRGLVDGGYPEVVLTGIHIGGYGQDLEPRSSLLELVGRVESETSLHRLRLGSIEPTELPDALLDTIAASQIICPHFHIPLQAGDDAVLRRMGRSYDTGFFAGLVTKVRARCPEAAIVLDVITGFPGESDEEFANTYRLVEALPVTDLHVFPYSRRPGTPAAEMPDQINGDVSRKRAEQLRGLAAVKRQAFAAGFVGRTLELVAESGNRNGQSKGVSRNYLDVRFEGRGGTPAGEVVLVRATSCEDGVLAGELLSFR